MQLRPILAFALFALPTASQQSAGVGQKVPEFSFPEFLNGDGRQSLCDFFGQPVLIEFWGTH
jgi:hypothetical protein